MRIFEPFERLARCAQAPEAEVHAETYWGGHAYQAVHVPVFTTRATRDGQAR